MRINMFVSFVRLFFIILISYKSFSAAVLLEAAAANTKTFFSLNDDSSGEPRRVCFGLFVIGSKALFIIIYHRDTHQKKHKTSQPPLLRLVCCHVLHLQAQLKQCDRNNCVLLKSFGTNYLCFLNINILHLN